jgi:WD40 repeat protein/transcriptional regulator with XRE-family HTH domain
VKRHVYRERDYAFAQLVLTLRTAIGLSQVGLAERLGASRRAVADWEGGLSYPKAERLKQLIALGMRASAFPVGREEEEIRALWKAAHQKVWLDEDWLHDLLASTRPVEKVGRSGTSAAHNGAGPSTSSRVDLVEALDVSHFAGREVEVAELSEWIVQERCRLVTLLGIGGIGKSTLASYLGLRLVPHFEAVLWRSLRDAPSCEELVADCITFFSETPPAEFPTSLEQRITQLMARLQASRCLLMLDNLETLLASGDPEGGYLPGYEGYGRLIERLAESAHQSCVLLTSRERPREIEALEGTRSPVRSLRLAGVDEQTARVLLSDKELDGTPAAWQCLVAGYAGNPLALKLVAQAITDLFGGDLDRFLQEGELIFNGVRPLLRQQVGRLSPLEHLLLTWLAVLREWTQLDALVQVLHPWVLRSQVLEALEALSRRSLVERGLQASFGLQSVVMEYLTDELGERLAEEIVLGEPRQLRQVALALAQAKHYVREIQVRLLVFPLLERLRADLGANAQIEAHLLRLLSQFRMEDEATQGYGPANVITLLKVLRGHLRGLDLSRLSIRGAYLQGVELQDANLAESLLQECVLDESFDAIWSVAASSPGQYCAVGSRRGEVRVWKERGRLLHLVWQAHTDVVSTLAFSPDGSTLASGSWDGTLKLWNLPSGALLWRGRHTNTISCLAFSPDGRLLASSGRDAAVQFWDAHSGTNLQILPHPGAVYRVIWSPDGGLLASGDFAGSIRLWQVQKTAPARCVQTIEGHTDRVLGLDFAPDGRTLASGSWDRTVKLWEVASGSLLQTLSRHRDKVHCVAWSRDGRTVASGSVDKTIWLDDVVQGHSQVALRGHSAAVYSLAFTSDSASLLSGGEDGTLRVWDVASKQCLRVMQGYAIGIYEIDWSPDGMHLVSGGTDTLVTIWDVTIGTASKVLQGHNWIVYGLAWSPDGRWLASCELHTLIRLWDATSGACVQTLQDLAASPLDVAWSPDGQLLAWGTDQHGLQVWDMTKQDLLWDKRPFSTIIHYVAWSPDGTRVVGGGDDGGLYLWGIADGMPRQRLPGHQGMATRVVWSPDGTRLASCGSSGDTGELFVWDVQSGERLQTFAGHSGIVYAAVWTPSGDLLVSGGSDGILRWWDVQSGKCLRMRTAHQGTVLSLRKSPDGKLLASCGDDGAIHIWELKSGEHVRTLRLDRPYERLTITGIQGLTQAEIATLRALGAVEDAAAESPGK